MRGVVVSFALIGLLGCDLTLQAGEADSGKRSDGASSDGGVQPGGDGGRAECLPGLSRADWFLVKQGVQGVLQDALQIAEESAKPPPSGSVMMWGALSVPWNNDSFQDGVGFAGSVDGLKLCDDALFCKAPRSPNSAVRFCAQTACEAPRGATISVAMTNPQVQTVGSTHTLSYAIDVQPTTRTDAGLSLGGSINDSRTVHYPSNPSVQWHVQYGATAGAEVTASPSFNLTATDKSNRVLDLSLSGAIVVNKPTAGDVPSEVTGMLTFPNVAGGALDVSFHLDATHQLVGEVTRAGVSVGSFRIELPTSLSVRYAWWTSACD